MNQELSDLIGDIREQLLYLNEIGAESLSVDLPVPSASLRPRSASVNPITAERIERFIPDLRIRKTEPPSGVSQTEKDQSRQGLLEASRLSHFSKGPSDTSPPSTGQKTVEKVPEPQPVASPHGLDFEASGRDLPIETVEEIRADIGDCRRCGLCSERTNIAHSTGNFNADLMFVGEAPGADEDAQGKPFVGRAGQLLTKIIEGIGLKREDVFIGNINRCRPPENRAPLPDETAACKPFLLREIVAVKPKVVVVLGNTATKNLLDTRDGITKIRGVFQDYQGVKVMPTFHPAYLLRDPSKKREVWEDMKKVRDYLNSAV